jgi:hypothetical protein
MQFGASKSKIRHQPTHVVRLSATVIPKCGTSVAYLVARSLFVGAYVRHGNGSHNIGRRSTRVVLSIVECIVAHYWIAIESVGPSHVHCFRILQ